MKLAIQKVLRKRRKQYKIRYILLIPYHRGRKIGGKIFTLSPFCVIQLGLDDLIFRFEKKPLSLHRQKGRNS